jgi:hypothetical protein
MNRLTNLFTIRLPEDAVKDMTALAKAQYMPTRTLIRSWIMQRLEAEIKGIKPAMGAGVGTTPPIAGSASEDASTSTPGGVIANDT